MLKPGIRIFFGLLIFGSAISCKSLKSLEKKGGVTSVAGVRGIQRPAQPVASDKSLVAVDTNSKQIKFRIQFASGNWQLFSSGYSQQLPGQVFQLSDDQKYRATLIDGSVMEGRLVQYDDVKREITLKTTTREYAINGAKLSKLEEAVISVRLILRDGNKRVGNLVEDKKGSITIKTILGVETYSRKEIRKIEYIK